MTVTPYASVLLALLSAAQLEAKGSLYPSRIVGGETAERLEYPFYAAYELYAQGAPLIVGVFFCGASLITRKSALTAAHCPESVRDLRSQIRISAFNRIFNEATESIRRELFRFNHPNYDSYVGSSFDVAVLNFNDPITANFEHITIGIYPAEALPNYALEALTVVGLGTLESEGDYLPQELQEAVVHYTPDNICRSQYGASFNPETMICASFRGRDSCSGDSGGPLFFTDENGQPQQIGIVSWGRGCAHPDYAGVYTRTSKVIIDFIQVSISHGTTPAPIPVPECTADEDQARRFQTGYAGVGRWPDLPIELGSDRTLGVSFRRSFARRPPTVFVALRRIDADYEETGSSLRVGVYAEWKTKSGFTVRAQSWYTSKTWSVGVQWIAVPRKEGSLNVRYVDAGSYPHHPITEATPQSVSILSGSVVSWGLSALDGDTGLDSVRVKVDREQDSKTLTARSWYNSQTWFVGINMLEWYGDGPLPANVMLGFVEVGWPHPIQQDTPARKTVSFEGLKHSGKGKPKVAVFLTGFDSEIGANIRIHVRREVRADDFDIIVESWHTSTVWWARVSYVVIGDGGECTPRQWAAVDDGAESGTGATVTVTVTAILGSILACAVVAAGMAAVVKRRRKSAAEATDGDDEVELLEELGQGLVDEEDGNIEEEDL